MVARRACGKQNQAPSWRASGLKPGIWVGSQTKGLEDSAELELISGNMGGAHLEGQGHHASGVPWPGWLWTKPPALLGRRFPRARSMEEEGQGRGKLGHLKAPGEALGSLLPIVQAQHRFRQEAYLLTDLGTSI